jgi:chorismate dehydratase
MQKIKVSVVSYSNSAPFVYGLLNSDIIGDINLSLDIPSVCADKVINGLADIGLIPTVEILRLKSYEILTNLCIGSNDYVKTVVLASEVPLNEITHIHLDYQSRTSVVLAKVLAKHFWKICPEWINAKPGFEETSIKGRTGAVIIGDRTFSINAAYRYDLIHEWKTFTNLPFVTANWVTTKQLDENFKCRFSQALNFGVQNLIASSQFYKNSLTKNVDLLDYLKNYISYDFDEPKRKAKDLFLTYAREIVDINKQTSIP